MNKKPKKGLKIELTMAVLVKTAYMSNSTPEITICKSIDYIEITLGNVYLKVPNNYSMTCMVAFICLHLRDKQGNTLLSYAKISKSLGYKSRQWPYNIYKKLKALNYDLNLFFQGYEALHVIEPQILSQVTKLVCQYPLKTVPDLLKIFNQEHGLDFNIYQMRKYITSVDTAKLLPALRKQFELGQFCLSAQYCIKLLLDQSCSRSQKQYIGMHTIGKEAKILPISRIKDDLTPILAYFYVSGCSLADLSLLFGMAKSTISGRIRNFAKDLDFFLPQAVTQFSGKICVDEKWVKISGQWQYVLTAVDAVSYIPLLSKRMPSLTIESWATFFYLFEQTYAVPQLVISDGDTKIAAALNYRWKKVTHQLCWFHKLKNLGKKISQHIKLGKQNNRAWRLLHGAFHNSSASARKKALKTLASFAPEPLANYVNKRMIGFWKKLNQNYTNNAAERYNRKLQRAFKPRYGIKNEPCADVLINLVWFKDYILNQNNQICLDNIFNFDVKQIAQNAFFQHNFIHSNVKQLVKKPYSQVS
jgi:transposase-like protein